MSRGYSTTPLWGLSRNSAVAGIFFVKISRIHIMRISALRWTENKKSKDYCKADLKQCLFFL